MIMITSFRYFIYGELVSFKNFTSLGVLNSLWEVLLAAQLPKLLNEASMSAVKR